MGCGFALNELVADGSILAHFPLHDREFRKILNDSWLPWSVQPWQQPIDGIKVVSVALEHSSSALNPLDRTTSERKSPCTLNSWGIIPPGC
jgi:hypothetical protein